MVVGKSPARGNIRYYDDGSDSDNTTDMLPLKSKHSVAQWLKWKRTKSSRTAEWPSGTLLSPVAL